MRVLIVAAELSSTTLFDLVAAQDIAEVLDLRIVGERAPRLLGRVYHRPAKALAGVAFQRAVSAGQPVGESLRRGPGLADHALLVLADRGHVDAMRRRILVLRPDAQIEVLENKP